MTYWREAFPVKNFLIQHQQISDEELKLEDPSRQIPGRTLTDVFTWAERSKLEPLFQVLG